LVTLSFLNDREPAVFFDSTFSSDCDETLVPPVLIEMTKRVAIRSRFALKQSGWYPVESLSGQ
jgi:hypothetical protein